MRDYFTSLPKDTLRSFIAPPDFATESLIIPDPVSLKAKLHAIKSAGPANLQILTDYDMTLTKAFFTDGRKAESSFRALSESKLVPDAMRELARDLYDKYRPIELDVSMDASEKTLHMIRWWEENL